MNTTMLAASSDFLYLVFIFGGGAAVLIVGIIVDAVQKIMRTRAREESRREIAAYVAEGSISPDDAAKLLSAGGSISDQVKDKLREKLGA